MKNKYYDFVGVYIFTYTGLGMLLPLLGQYLSYIGFDGVQIGAITSAATAIGIFASPFWGCRYHNSKDSERIIIFLCFALAIIAFFIVKIKIFLIFLLAYSLFSFFQSPVMPLTDAMTLEAKMPFGAIRKWGSISFAVGVFVAGQIAEIINLSVIFPICALAYICAAAIIIKLRRQGYELNNSSNNDNVNLQKIEEASILNCEEKKKANYLILFKNKKLMALLFAAFFICGTNVANNTYFGFLYKDSGGSLAGIGLAFLLMCSSEAPFMAWAEKLASKFGMEKIILTSMIISAGRYFWYSTGPDHTLLIFTFFLQGMVNGIVLVEFVRYVAKLVRPEYIGMAMTLYQSISSNTSSIICQMIGGIILDFGSANEVYLFFSLYNVIGIILYISFGLHKGSNQIKN